MALSSRNVVIYISSDYIVRQTNKQFIMFALTFERQIVSLTYRDVVSYHSKANRHDSNCYQGSQIFFCLECLGNCVVQMLVESAKFSKKKTVKISLDQRGSNH